MIASALLSACILLTPLAAPIRPGDVLLTRNAGGEGANPTPGWYNHASVYIGGGLVVEAQRQPGRVIVSDWREFVGRYEVVTAMRPEGVALARAAASQANSRYRALASRRPERLPRAGDNCVTVVRRAWKASAGLDPGWQVPDQLRPSSGK